VLQRGQVHVPLPTVSSSSEEASDLATAVRTSRHSHSY